MGLDSASAHIFVCGNPCLSSCRGTRTVLAPTRLVNEKGPKRGKQTRGTRTVLAPARLVNGARASNASALRQVARRSAPPPIIIGCGHQDGASVPTTHHP